MTTFAAIIAQATKPSGEVGELLESLDLDTTLAETPWSGWGLLLLAILAGVVGGKVLATLLRTVARRGEVRGWHTYATVFRSAAGPAHLVAIALGLTVGLAPVSLSPPVREFAIDALKLIYIVAIGWFLFEVVSLTDVLMRRFIHRHGSTDTGAGGTLESQFVPLIRKTLRIFLVAVFVLFAAENVFGADIGAWLAGLGIAGLAVSLAAQDSIKNLFGSLTIFLDKPFKVGERIVFDGHDGPVEEIGFRSTKVRTLTGDLVTIPNARIVDGSVRNVDRRPNIQRVFTLGLSIGTTPDQVRRAVGIVREVFAMPDVARAFEMDKLPPRVFFDELGSTSLNLKVYYWHHPPNWWAYSEHAQTINLEILRRFEEADIALASPTQTVHLIRAPHDRADRSV